MDIAIKDKFTRLWRKYFNSAEMPGSVARCLIGAMAEVRKGRSVSFNADLIGCSGGRRYLGFAERLRPDFEHFLSCGIPVKVEGERYKKSPGLVREIMANWPIFKAPKKIVLV